MKQTLITLRKSLPEELPLFAQMESDSDTESFIIPYTIQKHQETYAQTDILYLTILHNNQVCGFFILALNSDDTCVEFRRIVISEKGKGIGQQAISEMELFCKTTLKRSRIWLDVFDHNPRGRYIYEKLGYNHFKSEPYQNHILHFYEKSL